jgi:signal transduction histidine kinase
VPAAPAGQDEPVFSLLVVGLAAISMIATALVPGSPPYREADVWALLLAALGPLSLLASRFPLGPAPEPAADRPARELLPALTGAGTVVVLNAAAGYDIGFVQWPPWIAVFLCFAGAGLRVRAAATGIAAAAVCGYLALDRGALDAGLVTGIATSFVIAAVAGDASRTRRAHAASRQAELLSRNREQALIAEGLLLTERNRLARELHDSLGHSVNVMVLQAGVGRRVFAENPQFAQEALVSVETVGRSALEELDRLLRVLQPLGPGRDEELLAPTLSDLITVVDRVRATGRQVLLKTDPAEQLHLTSGAARALYRIVQEALTNAVRHSATGPIDVEIRQRAGEVVVVVGNPVAEPAPSDGPVRTIAGRGLINMRERARLEGGRLEAGPVAGGFQVRATLPMQPSEAGA